MKNENFEKILNIICRRACYTLNLISFHDHDSNNSKALTSIENLGIVMNRAKNRIAREFASAMEDFDASYFEEGSRMGMIMVEKHLREKGLDLDIFSEDVLAVLLILYFNTEYLDDPEDVHYAVMYMYLPCRPNIVLYGIEEMFTGVYEQGTLNPKESAFDTANSIVLTMREISDNEEKLNSLRRVYILAVIGILDNGDIFGDEIEYGSSDTNDECSKVETGDESDEENSEVNENE